jgi:hypothetical protein
MIADGNHLSVLGLCLSRSTKSPNATIFCDSAQAGLRDPQHNEVRRAATLVAAPCSMALCGRSVRDASEAEENAAQRALEAGCP